MNYEIRIGNKSDAVALINRLLSDAIKLSLDMYRNTLDVDMPELIPGLNALKDALKRDII